MSEQRIRSQGIYHGLPVYPSDLDGLTAIVVGANGISGHYMLRVLAESPKRWKRIVCMSRRAPFDQLPANAEHIAVDLLQAPDKTAAALKQHNVAVDYVFFFAYLQPPPKEPASGIWSDADELVRLNTLLLSNFLSALQIASLQPKRVLLQTGGKNYGGHLGHTTVPQEEDDARINFEPNFYYSQEDVLRRYCAEAQTTTKWNICMPSTILGAVPDAAMNFAYPLAIYANVCRALKQPLKFPGSIESFTNIVSISSAQMNAYMEEWAVLLAPGNEKFNTCDHSIFAWEKAWPRVAEWYGLDSEGPQESETYSEKTTTVNPRGYGSKVIARASFSLAEWARRENVRQTWQQLAEQYGLANADLATLHGLFAFLDGPLSRSVVTAFSTNKSRKLGWHGFVDSTEALLDVFHDLARIRLIPPVPEVQQQGGRKGVVHPRTVLPASAVSFETHRDISAKKAKYGQYADQKLFHRLREVALPDATFTFYEANGSVKVYDGREFHFTSLNDTIIFFTSVSDAPPTLHMFGPPTMEMVSGTEVAATWAMTDSMYVNGHVMHGAGYYDERWVYSDGEWWLRQLKLNRTFVQQA